MKKILIILVFGILITMNAGAVFVSNNTIQKEHSNPYLLIRIHNQDMLPLFQEDIEIVATKPGEWIDIIIQKNDIYKIEELEADFEIIITDVEKHNNKVRWDYHSFPDVETFIQNIATNYPNITSLYSIGTSYEGRDLWCLEISDNPGVDENEPGVFFMGLHHAREWPSLEICLYICDNLTSNYGVIQDITDVVDNNRIWIVPCVNPDGYVWDHDLGHDSRKNRHNFPQWGTTGVDLNRNYAGSSNGDPWGSWGSIGDAHVSNNPSSELFNGPMALSELETQAIRDIFLNNDICAAITYHTHGELVLWPWSYSVTEVTPDDSYLSYVGTEIANRITEQDGTGTYDPDQGSGLYPTTGDTTDWGYGYSYYELGRTTFVYTIEACSSFHPSSSYLNQVTSENFDGALYLLQEAQNISNVIPQVLPPLIDNMTYDPDGTYYVSWNQQNPVSNPDYYQLDELKNLTVTTDDSENGSSLWTVDGFSLSTARSHSGITSYKSRGINYDVSAMTTNEPIPVTPDMNLSFWTWYDIETNYDKAFVEVSHDGRFYEILENYTGSSNGWIYQEFPLDKYINESIYLRFRYTTDAGTLDEGFYVDDIYPIPDFGTITTLSNSIINDSYLITGNPEGTYYYRVKGHNTQKGWGDFSTLESIQVGQANQYTHITNLQKYWNFLSIPFESILPVINIFVNYSDQAYTWFEATTNNNPTGSPLISPYVFGWNRIGQYYEFVNSLEQGHGYWMFSYQDCELKSPLMSTNNGDYITSLVEKWNLIGIPFNENVSKTDLLVNDINWSDAVTTALVSDFIFGWDRNGQYYNFADIIEPGYAYWIYCYQTSTLKRDI